MHRVLTKRKFLTTASVLVLSTIAPHNVPAWVRGGPPPSIELFLFWLSDGNSLDPTFEPNYIGGQPVLGDSLTFRVYTNAGLTNLYTSANKVLDTSAISTGSFTLAGLTTLLAGNTYWVQAELVRAGVSYLSNVVSRTMIP